jgi:hypothetical protein
MHDETRQADDRQPASFAHFYVESRVTITHHPLDITQQPTTPIHHKYADFQIRIPINFCAKLPKTAIFKLKQSQSQLRPKIMGFAAL